MRLSELKLKGDNPRTIKDEKFTKLVNSIKEFPKMLELRPLIYDPATMEVLGGNMRLSALKKLGYREIPDSWVKAASELTEEEKKRFLIVDNVGFGEWDYDMITNNWDTMELTAWGFDMPEFEAEKIPAAQEDNYEIPDEIKTDIILGDLFEIGEHRLLCGDATKADSYKKLFEGKVADMICTDPPYNVAYEGATKDKLTIMNDKMSNSNFYQFLFDFFTAQLAYAKKGGGWYIWHSDTEGQNFRTAMKDSG